MSNTDGSFAYGGAGFVNPVTSITVPSTGGPPSVTLGPSPLNGRGILGAGLGLSWNTSGADAFAAQSGGRTGAMWLDSGQLLAGDSWSLLRLLPGAYAFTASNSAGTLTSTYVVASPAGAHEFAAFGAGVSLTLADDQAGTTTADLGRLTHAWSSSTPTAPALPTAPVLTGTHRQITIGKLVMGTMQAALATAPVGTYRVNSGVTPWIGAGGQNAVGYGFLYDVSLNTQYPITVRSIGGTQWFQIFLSAAYPGLGIEWSNAAPVAAAVGDFVEFSYMMEAA